jgi:hypothetical protein
MKQKNLLFALLAVAGLAYYYFFGKGKAAKPVPKTSPGAGQSANPNSSAFLPSSVVAGAPVPTLQTQLAVAGVNTAGSLLQALLGGSLSKPAGSGGGSSGSGSGGSKGGGSSGGGSGGGGNPTTPKPIPTPQPNPTSSTLQTGSSPYYTDPLTGITYGPDGPVSGIPTTPGIPYVNDSGNLQSTDLLGAGIDAGLTPINSGNDFTTGPIDTGSAPTPIDFSGSDTTGISAPIDYTPIDTSGIDTSAPVDTSGGSFDFSGGDGGGDGGGG